MNYYRLATILFSALLGLQLGGRAIGQSCPVSCAATKVETVIGTIPTEAGLSFSADFATPKAGTALTGCVASPDCKKCTVDITVEFEWTGAPANRFKLRLVNHNGTSEIEGKYERDGILFRTCPDSDFDFLRVELLDANAVVYSVEVKLYCGC